MQTQHKFVVLLFLGLILSIVSFTPTLSFDDAMEAFYNDENMSEYEPVVIYRKRGLRQMRMGKRSPHGLWSTEGRRGGRTL
ncbi:unnamed protein product [Echinostoma caproni]|uniref:FMRF-Like Peptide n=1 Tax=Echinostoma caproni TaxID=27848 RepID=A0A183A5B6_9TREM|nr:unnamed protein product [Echinostoma caproni]